MKGVAVVRLRCRATVLVTLIDGTVVRGVVTRAWRWRVIRLVDVDAMTGQGPVPAAGPVLIPHRSVLLAQEVTRG